MIGSLLLYAALALVCVGAGLRLAPIEPFGLSRWAGLLVAGVGVALSCAALILPVAESRDVTRRTRLDEFSPVWQFREFHTLEICAPPARVFDAIKRVRADEISFFRTLTWIRRGGRSTRHSILNAGGPEPLIDVALTGGFVLLAEDAPRELVVGSVVAAPPGFRPTPSGHEFRKKLPPGFALAAMNFLVVSDGAGGSRVSTETRVFANSPAVRRRFAAYWRSIYPGSALIRRMWLRAIARRATEPGGPPSVPSP
jgi:hypothetical protein